MVSGIAVIIRRIVIIRAPVIVITIPPVTVCRRIPEIVWITVVIINIGWIVVTSTMNHGVATYIDTRITRCVTKSDGFGIVSVNRHVCNVVLGVVRRNCIDFIRY
jgi:hypothetical protein